MHLPYWAESPKQPTTKQAPGVHEEAYSSRALSFVLLTCRSHMSARGFLINCSSIVHSSSYFLFLFVMKSRIIYIFLISSQNQVVLFCTFLEKIYVSHGDHCIVLLEFHLVVLLESITKHNIT